MAIFGIGARYENEDVSQEFKDGGFAGTGWPENEAPDLHEFFKSLKTDDIVYLKAEWRDEMKRLEPLTSMMFK